jgi:hypothetical protein
MEIIASLKADVVFEYAPIPDVADAIQDKIGVSVVCVQSSQFDFDMLRIMGLITGTEEKGGGTHIVCWREDRGYN